MILLEGIYCLPAVAAVLRSGGAARQNLARALAGCGIDTSPTS
jgi:hypothetical protein